MKITSLYKQNCEDEFCINLLLKLSNSTHEMFISWCKEVRDVTSR